MAVFEPTNSSRLYLIQCGSEPARESALPDTVIFSKQQKTRKAHAIRVFSFQPSNQRLNRATNEYWVFAVFVSSSLSNAELCACSEV